jgi:GAF domain-containing protein
MADDVVEELGRLAAGVGPALAPAGGEDLLRSIAATAQRQFRAAACSLALLTPDDTELVFTTVVGEGEQGVTGLRIPSGHGIAGWVVMSGQPLLVSDLRNDPRWAGAVDDGYQPTSILAAPVATEHRLLGVLEVLDRDPDRPDAEHDMELLGLVADQAALAIEGARVFDDFGRELLRAAAAVAGEPLAERLTAAAGRIGPPDGDLLELARLVGDLGRLDPSYRRLAIRMVQQVVDHAEEARPGRSPRRG